MDENRTRSAAQMRAKTAARKSKPKSPAAPKRTQAKSSRDKVRAYRERMRAQGMRLVQMWLPSEPSAGEDRRAVPRRSPAAVKQEWAAVLTDRPSDPVTFDSIADLIGSVAGLPTDLSARKKHYLQVTGYGRKRHR